MYRALVELVLEKHYRLDEGKLWQRIDAACASVSGLPRMQLHQIAARANEVLHPSAKQTVKKSDMIAYLSAIKSLIERAPRLSGR